MRILVIVSGGREHALCWAIAASPLCDRLYAAPGNPGIAELATCAPIGVMEFDRLLAFIKAEDIDFVVVGPEAPLVAGLVDRLDAEGVAAFGPNAAAAALEGSKGFTKDLCAKYGIPTAAYRRFSDAEAAKDYVRAQGAPIVVKADGLAAGKGVTVAASIEEALAAVEEALVGHRFGKAGAEVVIEEFLEGEEASVFALVDGRHSLLLASAQDHKRVGDGDTGPNTGGMGAYCPAPLATPELLEQIDSTILVPTVHALKRSRRPFRGILYAGMMVTNQGSRVLEFNCRLGDPETQPLLMRL
ncbi:MAG TPA: phosphoribosylamine--glycine ligase, partial [Stellaceae bacterium]|nr:phosphoribosylamine--glycine ligase [Stellaceae bacterium]